MVQASSIIISASVVLYAASPAFGAAVTRPSASTSSKQPAPTQSSLDKFRDEFEFRHHRHHHHDEFLGNSAYPSSSSTSTARPTTTAKGSDGHLRKDTHKTSSTSTSLKHGATPTGRPGSEDELSFFPHGHGHNALLTEKEKLHREHELFHEHDRLVWLKNHPHATTTTTSSKSTTKTSTRSSSKPTHTTVTKVGFIAKTTPSPTHHNILLKAAVTSHAKSSTTHSTTVATPTPTKTVKKTPAQIRLEEEKALIDQLYRLENRAEGGHHREQSQYRGHKFEHGHGHGYDEEHEEPRSYEDEVIELVQRAYYDYYNELD